jgi:AcrR family transcriptional regulator
MIKKEEKKGLKKEAILHGAAGCFTKFGYEKTTLDDIGKSAALNKASIYYYFKNKEEILSILSHKSRLLLLEKFKKIKTMNLSAIDQLKQIVKENYFFYKESPLNYNLISLYEADNNLIETPEIANIGKEISEEAETRLCPCLLSRGIRSARSQYSLCSASF